MSIGYNLGSWLMGGLNTLGGWLGMGNFGGFGNIGGGWLGMGNFGGGNWLSGTNTSSTNSSSSNKTDTKTIEKTDSEYKPIIEARTQLQALLNKKGPVTAEEIKALNEQIGKLTNKDNINELIEKYQNAKKNKNTESLNEVK